MQPTLAHNTHAFAAEGKVKSENKTKSEREENKSNRVQTIDAFSGLFVQIFEPVLLALAIFGWHPYMDALYFLIPLLCSKWPNCAFLIRALLTGGWADNRMD